MLYIKDLYLDSNTVLLINTESGSSFNMSFYDVCNFVENTDMPVFGVRKLKPSEFQQLPQDCICDGGLLQQWGSSDIPIIVDIESKFSSHVIEHYTIDIVDEDEILKTLPKYDKYRCTVLKLKLVSNEMKLYYDKLDDMTRTVCGVGVIIHSKREEYPSYGQFKYRLVNKTLEGYDSDNKIRFSIDISELNKFSIPDVVDKIECNCLAIDYPCIVEISDNSSIEFCNLDKLSCNIVLVVPKSYRETLKDVQSVVIFK